MENLITKIKLKMLTSPNMTFFCTILFNLDIHEDNSIPTACTDGNFIKLNKDFFTAQSLDEQIFLFLHEIMHIALSHLVRQGTRKPKRFNAACDYAVNYILVESGYKMPSKGLYDKKYADMSAEQIYELLPDEPNYEGEQDLVFSNSKSEIEKLEERTKVIVLQAAVAEEIENTGKGIGTTSAGLKRELNKLLHPKLPWQLILQDSLNAFIEDDYSLEYPDEEYLPHNLYVPTLYSEGLGTVDVCVDVSGSISNKELDVILIEINNLQHNLNPTELRLIAFDTEIQVNKTYNRGDYINIQDITLEGGGGTSLNKVVDLIQVNKSQLAIIITDGYVNTRVINKLTNTSLVWVILNNPRFSLKGQKIIHVNTGEY